MSEGAWQGARPSPLQASATLYGGIVAIMIAGVQPIVLGALVDANRISLAQLGSVATLEILGIGLGSSAGSWLLPRFGARGVGFASSAAVAACDFAMAYAPSADAIFALRALAGLASGVLIALPVAMIARAPAPERWSGIFLTTQTLAQAAGAWAIPALVAPRFGPLGGFDLLGAMAVASCATALVGSREGTAASSGADGAHGAQPIPPRAWLGLAWIFASLGSTMAVWSYFDRVGAAQGFAPAFVGAIAATSLLTQAAGSFAAILFGQRFGWVTAAVAAGIAQIASIAAFGLPLGRAAFVAAASVFGFFWLFGLPYQVRALVELDPSRRAARQIASAQLIGGSAGPYVASWFVRGSSVGGVLRFGALATVASLAIAGVASVWSRRA